MIGEKVEDEPRLYVQPWIGYRCWLLTEDADLEACIQPNVVYATDGDVPAVCLKGVNYSRKAGNIEVGTKPPEHPAPKATCNCGYWAFDSYEGLRRFTVGRRDKIVRSIRGLAIGWGQMVICQYGWRAQYIRPIALMAWPERTRWISPPPPIPTDEQMAEDRIDAARWNEVAKTAADRYAAQYVSSPADLDVIAADWSHQ